MGITVNYAMDRLRAFPLVYLATPYSKYPRGIEAAFQDAAKLAGGLLQLGVRAYSPIAHTHPIATYASIDPMDHSIWLPFDSAIMNKADAILVAKMESWEDSKGVAHEIDFFKTEGKPVFFLDPATLIASEAQ